MPCNYEVIRHKNIERYGTDGARKLGEILARLYDKQTHFIFELLQNAEDALARRKEWEGSRAVRFDLDETSLRVSHYGDPFNDDDVWAICDFDESTKEFNEIGEFGIGFKSVYEFTDRPEIHSGSETFTIKKFVMPEKVSAIDRHTDETVIQIPFKDTGAEESTNEKIVAGLQSLGASSLLFLREIEEIAWSVEGGASGQYLRESKKVAPGVRRVTIIGEKEGERETDEEWLVFSSHATTDDVSQARPVEIAFSCIKSEESESRSIRRVDQSPLVVFFPTAIETHLGFLIQGPYRTTPSRDNISRDDDCNKRLVEQTASLLRKSLCWLRDEDLLDTDALQCLPLDSSKLKDTMFSPIFEGAKDTLQSESLLPRFNSGYTEADCARLGRTQGLRELFRPTQLTALYGESQELTWLSDDITQDRTPGLRRYLMQELNIEEIETEDIIRRLDQEFLKAQTDDWIRKLYEFLSGQRALRRNRWFDRLPLIRLEDGTHVPAKADDRFLAFLPSETTTDFPTVRNSVCTTEPAREFLESLGLKKPDLVEDVIEHVLPKYKKDEIDISDADYEDDIQRILTAFDTDSEKQRNRLINAIKTTKFVKAVDAADSLKYHAKTDSVYLATDRLKNLFKGVTGVLLVDDSHSCLRGAKIRGLLEKSGAFGHLRPISDDSLTHEERLKLRENAGQPETSGRNDYVEDRTLKGLEELLVALPNLNVNQQKNVAKLLWDELAHVAQNHFTGVYSWTFYGSYKQEFDAAFVRRLNATAWILGDDGELHRPEFVSFDLLGWDKNPFIESKIHFKSQGLEMLASEMGVSLEMFELIKEENVNMADLKAFLEQRDKAGESKSTDSSEAGATTPPQNGDGFIEPGSEVSAGQGGPIDRESHDGGGDNNTSADSASPREFISYVAVGPDEEELDPDGLEQEKRMNLEAEAIERILAHERDWRRTEQNNPGYDLYKVDSVGRQSCWCEVKAMKGSLQNRPVGISHTQFGYAIERGESYWLYVVEYADDDEKYRIVKIQDPVGKARTFTFDRGWIDVAEEIKADVAEQKP